MLSLVDRNSGRAKSMVVDNLKAATLLPISKENIAKEAIVYTDEAKHYSKLIQDFADHDFTTRSKGRYVCGAMSTPTLLRAISAFLSGMKGVYQHCSKEHLRHQVTEYEFRYNNRDAHKKR